MKKDFFTRLGFTLKDNSQGVYLKKYHDNSIIEIDFEKQEIKYLNIECESKTTSNFSQPENFVVLECVNRLLEKGYFAKDIILEKTYKLGHINKGRLDILVKKDEKTFLMIECKTWGKEFDKELKNIQKDGGQLFSYFQQDRDTEFIVLYASNLDGKEVEYQNEIIKIEESYRETSNVKDFFDRWNKFTKQNGIFDAWVNAYDFESKALTLQDLKNIKETDASFIFNRFLEILRHNTVSDKGNAFNKIFTLFLCKIHDEGTKMQDEELEFQWTEGIDTHITFQTRLTDLYKKGMLEFLSKEITDFSDKQINDEFGYLDESVRIKILEKFTKIRLQKNNEFAIKEVFDDETFEDNGKVLKEVVELLQNYRVRYTKKQPFLGDFFELLLTTGLKQEAGQFFTPVPIARFICKSIPIQKVIEDKILKGDTTDLLPTTIDYAAGSGHFLTESMEEIQNIINTIDTGKLRPNVKKELDKWKATAFDWAFEYMYGIEKDYRLVKTAKVGCYLHGDGIATVIHGDGLDSFEHSKSYKEKLKKYHPEDKQENAQFDFVLSNPPYSVSSFKGNLKSEQASQDFELFENLTDNSSEIEALFIERTKQLLKEGGIAAIILPSSILSNTGIYTKAREIILKNFEIISLVSLGSNTFMATGTNTVVLFLRKRNKFFANNLEKSIHDVFKNLVDVSLGNIENVFSKYVSYVWEGLSFEDYKTLVLKNPNEKIINHELYKEYSKKLKLAKNDDLFDEIVKVEKEKMLYFVLSYHQNVVLVKSGEKQIEKEFLGYEFSFRKGSEGIHPMQGGKLIDECTKLFDPEILDNPEKVSTYIYDGFSGNFTREISQNLQEHIFRVKLTDLLTFDRVEFEKTISTNPKKKIEIETKWELVKIEDIQKEIINGKTPLKVEGKYWNSKDINWFTVPDFTDSIFVNESSQFVSKSGLDVLKIIPINSVLISCTATIGKIGVNNIELTTNQQINSIICNDKVLPLFLAYFLKLNNNIFEGLTDNSGVKHINLPTLKNIKIPLPPLDIQKKIVDEIEILEKEEQEKKEKVEVLKNSVQSLFESSINGNHKIYRLSDDSIFELGIGKRLLKSEILYRGSVPVYSANVFEPFGYIKENLLKDFSRKSVIWGIDGDWMVNFMNENSEFYPTDHCGYLRIKDGQLNERFVAYFLEKEGKNFGFSRANRASIDRIQNLKIPLPPLENQKKIVAEIEKIEREIDILENHLKTIPERKKEILKKYL